MQDAAVLNVEFRSMDSLMLVRLWRADLVRRRPIKTARTYSYFVNAALSCPESDLPHPLEITREQIESYLEERTANQHRQSVHTALTDFFDWLYRYGHRDYNLLKVIARPKFDDPEEFRKAYEPDELRRLLTAAVYMGAGRQRWSDEGTRFAWALLANYATGARPNELLSLDADHVKLQLRKPRVLIFRTKTNRWTTVPLCQVGVEAFRELCRGHVGALFHYGVPNYWRLYKRVALEAGIPEEKAHPYALRHTFATRLLESGVDRRVLMDLMGHRDHRSLNRYTVPDVAAYRAVSALDALEVDLVA